LQSKVGVTDDTGQIVLEGHFDRSLIEGEPRWLGGSSDKEDDEGEEEEDEGGAGRAEKESGGGEWDQDGPHEDLEKQLEKELLGWHDQVPLIEGRAALAQ